MGQGYLLNLKGGTVSISTEKLSQLTHKCEELLETQRKQEQLIKNLVKVCHLQWYAENNPEEKTAYLTVKPQKGTYLDKIVFISKKEYFNYYHNSYLQIKHNIEIEKYSLDFYKNRGK